MTNEPKPGVKRKWWVYSTAIANGVLMLECRETGEYGIVRNPSREEWAKAFYAPSNPYRWRGGDDRVELEPMSKGESCI